MALPIFKVVQAGDVFVDISCNLPVHIFRAFAIYDAAPTLIAEEALGPATPLGQIDWQFTSALPFPCTLAVNLNCIGPAQYIGQALALEIILWQGDGPVKKFPLTPVIMKSKTANGVTLAEARKSAWIGLQP